MGFLKSTFENFQMNPLQPSFVGLPFCTVRRVEPTYNADTVDDIYHIKATVFLTDVNLPTSLYFRIENIVPHHVKFILQDKEKMSAIAYAIVRLSFEFPDVLHPGGTQKYVPKGSKNTYAKKVLEDIEKHLKSFLSSAAIRTCSLAEPHNKQIYLPLPNNIMFHATTREIRSHHGTLIFAGDKYYFKFAREQETIFDHVKVEALENLYRKHAKEAFGFMENLGIPEEQLVWNAPMTFVKVQNGFFESMDGE